MNKAEKQFVLSRSYPLFAAYYFDLQVADFHAAMASHWQDNRFSLTLVPMQHGKSTTMKIDIIRNICLNPNVRIILTTATKDDADEYVRAIESELTGNKKLLDDFGPFYNRDRWTSSGFRVCGCQHTNVHDTLEVFGSGTWNQKGHGCEIVYVDDIVTEETCLTPEARAKQLRYFNMAVASGPRAMWTIDPRYGLQVPAGVDWPKDAPYNPVPGDPDGEYGQVIVMGTCFDPKDLYDTLRHAPKYKTLYLDCYWDHQKWEPDKTKAKALWPEVWPIGRINAMRYEMGWSQDDFDKRMRNIARSASEIVFRREWFYGDDGYPGCIDDTRSFGELPKDDDGQPMDLFKALGFDPASGKATVFAAWPTFDLIGIPRGVDPGEATRYLIDVYREKTGVEWLIDVMLDGNHEIPHPGFYNRYRYDICKVEANGFANLMLTHNRISAAKRRGVLIEPHETQRNKRDPVIGVKSMEAIFREGKVNIPYKTDRDQKLADQIIDQFVDFAFDRSGRKRSLTDYLMAFWFAELAIRGMSDRPVARPSKSGRKGYVIRNPYHDRYRRST
jgi:hypothetical protein